MQKIRKMSVLLMLFIAFLCSNVMAMEEVEKGKVPHEFLDQTVKELPIGVKIWDLPEAMEALNNPESKVLWVDTRPSDFYQGGTLKKAIMLVYNKDEKLNATVSNPSDILTKENLQKAIDESGAEKVVFFCQGPKCHRSYNAVLRAVQNWGIATNKVVWFRDGYPAILNHLQSDPKLTRKMRKYLKGAVLNI